MLVPRAEIMEGRAAILRSAHLPRPMAAEVAVLVRVLLCQVLAVVAEASVQRVPLHPHQVLMAVAVAAMAALLPESVL